MSAAIVLAVFVALLTPLPVCVWHRGRPGARLADEVEAWLRSRQDLSRLARLTSSAVGGRLG
jgi:hypothetical protein